MPVPIEEDPLLAALHRQEEEAQERQAQEADEAMRLKQMERPNTDSPMDAYLMFEGKLLPKPEGFLAGDQMWMRGSLSLTVGPGGVLKTWFSMFVLGQIARGLQVQDLASRQGRTLMLSEELNRATMLRRMLKLWSRDEAFDIDDALCVSYSNNFDFFSRTKESQKRLERLWRESKNPDVIVTDAYAYIHHGNENSNQDMSIVCGAILEVARECGFHANIIHHTGKASEFRKGSDRIRGASVIQNIVSDIFLIDKASNGRSSLEITKHRDYEGREIEPFVFGLEPRMDNPDLLTVTFSGTDAPVVDQASIETMVDAVDQLAGNDGEVLKAALFAHLGWGRRKFDEVLAECVRTGRVIRKQRGKEAAYHLPRGIRSQDGEGN